jgi:hypothetical protein
MIRAKMSGTPAQAWLAADPAVSVEAAVGADVSPALTPGRTRVNARAKPKAESRGNGNFEVMETESNFAVRYAKLKSLQKGMSKVHTGADVWFGSILM